MKTVTILKGLPASGKSTWAKEQVVKSDGKIKRINKDDLRAMLDISRYSKDNERFINHIKNAIVWQCLYNGYDVIIDDTNFDPRVTNKIVEQVEKFKLVHNDYDVQVNEKFFDIPLDECIKRNKNRPNSVPEEAIINMHDKWILNKG